MGSRCSTAVEHMPSNSEVMGLNPVKWGAFFLLYLLSSASIINVP